MAPTTIDHILRNVLAELDTARHALSEAASWARSDWFDRRALTDAEAEARTAVFATAGAAKDAIDQTRGLICQAQDVARQTSSEQRQPRGTRPKLSPTERR